MNGTKKSVGALTVALAVVGSVVLLGSGAAGAVNSVRDDTRTMSTSFSASQAEELKVDVNSGELKIEYYAGSEVQFEASGDNADRWKVDASDRTIRVQSPEHRFDWFSRDWFGGDWFDGDWLDDEWVGVNLFDNDSIPFRWAGGDSDSGAEATLRLPDTLAGIDADLRLDAGKLEVDASFGQVDVTVNAGALELAGSAEQLAVTVNAGQADVDLDDVTTGAFSINAGRITAELAGSLDSLDLRVSAGALTLTLPDQPYDLRRNETVGSIQSDLSEASNSRHRIDARLTAGNITLRTDDSHD